MNKLRWILALGGVVGLALVLMHARAVSQLRLQNQVLRTEPPALETPSADTIREVEELRLANRDLLKLRNQLRDLRGRTAELEQARAENARLKLTPAAVSGSQTVPPGFTPREALADVGTTSPEAVVQTTFWAMCEGNVARLLECASPRLIQRQKLDVLQDRLKQETAAKEMRNSLRGFAYFRIIERIDIAPDQAQVKLQSSENGPLVTMTVVRIRGEWKLDRTME
jgi:hypothetical protein